MDQFFTNNTQSIVTSNRILYTPSAFARTSLLHLQEIGELTALRPHVSSRSGLSSYLFFTIVSGSGSLNYGEKEYKLEAGDCVFIDCNSPYSHTTSADNLWTLRWIHFFGPTIPAIYNKYKERGGRPVFKPEAAEKLEEVWSELMKVAKSADYMRDMKINASLSELLVLVMSESWHPEDATAAKKKASVADVKAYLDQKYCQQSLKIRLIISSKIRHFKQRNRLLLYDILYRNSQFVCVNIPMNSMFIRSGYCVLRLSYLLLSAGKAADIGGFFIRFLRLPDSACWFRRCIGYCRIHETG